jgi:hypothetical protein
VRDCPDSFNAVEDCARACPPGEAPSLPPHKVGELSLAGNPEVVQCRNRKEEVVNPCMPLPCKSPVDFPGVLSVENYNNRGDCTGEDIANGTVCEVQCRQLHYFFDTEYVGEGVHFYPGIVPFLCNQGRFQIAAAPGSYIVGADGSVLKSSSDGVLGSEYQCLLEGSKAQTVDAVSATMGLTMPQAHVKLCLENEEDTIRGLEETLFRAIGGVEAVADTLTVNVLPPLTEVAVAEGSAAERRLSDALSILRATFVAYSPDDSFSTDGIIESLNEFRADEEAMKAQFTDALKKAGVSVTVLGVSVSEPEVINYNVIDKPDKDLEAITRERMRDVAMIGSAVSVVVIVLCIFWTQIKPCVLFILRKLNFVRHARQFKERREAEKLAKKTTKKQKSLQVEFVP